MAADDQLAFILPQPYATAQRLRQAAQDAKQRLIDRAMSSLQQQLDTADDDFGWIKWPSRDRFARECREGDSVIRIWSWHGAKRPKVLRCRAKRAFPGNHMGTVPNGFSRK